ncbi:MAG: SIS domain-containing protein [Candidatus Diapherotrites archaeon]|nr:SIS domain-containing protein [Candidatus Diapherotrites archaeon]
MENILNNIPKQFIDARELGKGLKITKPKQVIIAGMGGSALAGRIMQNLNPSIPITLASDYELPETNDNTLVIVVSYSGNTEEALSLYEDAKQKGLSTITLSSGGKLEQKADNTKHIKLPTGFQPRLALGYQLLPILNVLTETQVIQPFNYEEITNFLQEHLNEARQKGKQIEKHYGSPQDIEFSIFKGKVSILQTRPLTT